MSEMVFWFESHVLALVGYLIIFRSGPVQFPVYMTGLSNTNLIFKYDASLVLEHSLRVECLRTHGTFLVNWPSISYRLGSPPTRTAKEAVRLAIDIRCCI